tara:strand:+ start:623 stop:1006 length:384 start_codon:yes stop_codon:yes gene_type:complete
MTKLWKGLLGAAAMILFVVGGLTWCHMLGSLVLPDRLENGMLDDLGSIGAGVFTMLAGAFASIVLAVVGALLGSASLGLGEYIWPHAEKLSNKLSNKVGALRSRWKAWSEERRVKRYNRKNKPEIMF